MIITQQQIPKRCNSCKECLAPLTRGAFYSSRLCKGEREDFCLTCWNDDTKKIKEEASCCQWTASIPEKKAVLIVSQTKQEQALRLLQEYLAFPTDENASEALVLALYLARKKVLFFRKNFMQEGQEYSLYEINDTEEMLMIRKVPFQMLDLAKLQSIIAEKLTKTILKAQLRL